MGRVCYLLTALSTSFIGAGLVRFAYTPLLPVLIESRWFDTSATVYLSAANPAGALFGAVTSSWLARRYSKVSILRGMNVLATLSLLACAFQISIEWYFFWRFLSGIATGATIVLVAATFLPHVPADRKGVASGLIFAGLGLGIVATGTLVPFLLRFGLQATWIWLAVFADALTVLTWTSWPPSEFVTKREEGTHHRQVPSRPGYLVHCFTYIPSAVEAPRAQWQGARREHSLSPTRPTSNAGNASASPQPSGPGLFSAHPASLSRHVSHRICSSFDSLLEPKIASGRAWDISETVH